LPLPALLSCLSISLASAAGGLYVGAGIGQATMKDDTLSGNFDASDAAYKAFVGYRFNLIPIIDLAAEAGYTDFGKPSQDVGGQNVQFKLHGFDAAGLLIFPLGPSISTARSESCRGASIRARPGLRRARPGPTRSTAWASAS